MKINRRQFGILSVAAIVVLTTASFALSQRPQGPPDGPFRGGRGPGDGLGPLARDLNLTEDQKTQISKIQDSFRGNDKALLDQMRTLRQDEPDSLAGAFDEAAVRAAAEARAKIQVELEISRAKMMSQIAAVLTPEQRAQLVARRQGPPPRPE